MTLDTRMYVHDEVPVRELFTEFRRLLGATNVHPIEDRDVGDIYGAGIWHLGHPPGIGLSALVSIEYRPSQPLRPDERACHDWCEPGDGYHHHDPASWCSVSMDTAYGYKDEHGRGCGDLHASYVAQLGRWLDARGVGWSWRNEFTGEVHGGDDRYDRLRDLVSNGAEAQDWFRTTVAPAIALSLAQSSQGATDV